MCRPPRSTGQLHHPPAIIGKIAMASSAWSGVSSRPWCRQSRPFTRTMHRLAELAVRHDPLSERWPVAGGQLTEQVAERRHRRRPTRPSPAGSPLRMVAKNSTRIRRCLKWGVGGLQRRLIAPNCPRPDSARRQREPRSASSPSGRRLVPAAKWLVLGQHLVELVHLPLAGSGRHRDPSACAGQVSSLAVSRPSG